MARCSSSGDVEPDHAPRALRSQRDRRAAPAARRARRRARQLGAREVDEQPAREHRGRLGGVRVDALLPPVRALGAETEALRRAQHPDRLEVRRLEQHLGRRVRRPRESSPPMIAASATGSSPSVISRSVGSSSRCVPSSVRSFSPSSRAPDDDAPAGQLRAVERVERAAPDVHHVVRHVDDVRDRAHPGRVEPGAQPLRRRADADVAEHAADVARAAVEVLDARRPPRLGAVDGGSSGVGQPQLAAAERRDLARDARPSTAGRRGSSSASRRAPARRAAARRRAASPARARPGAA